MSVMKKKLFWLPAILLMIVIFYFSNQPAEVSGELSGGISYQIVSLVADKFEQAWSVEEMQFISEKIDYPLRKLAHLTEYAFLGMAVALGVVYGSNFVQCNSWRQWRLTQVIGSLYAASDEIHQLFVPGRAGRISDVIIDSVGVLIGWGVFVVLVKKYYKYNLKNEIDRQVAEFILSFVTFCYIMETRKRTYGRIN